MRVEIIVPICCGVLLALMFAGLIGYTIYYSIEMKKEGSGVIAMDEFKKAPREQADGKDKEGKA